MIICYKGLRYDRIYIDVTKAIALDVISELC